MSLCFFQYPPSYWIFFVLLHLLRHIRTHTRFNSITQFLPTNQIIYLVLTSKIIPPLSQQYSQVMDHSLPTLPCPLHFYPLITVQNKSKGPSLVEPIVNSYPVTKNISIWNPLLDCIHVHTSWRYKFSIQWWLWGNGWKRLAGGKCEIIVLMASKAERVVVVDMMYDFIILWSWSAAYCRISGSEQRMLATCPKFSFKMLSFQKN